MLIGFLALVLVAGCGVHSPRKVHKLAGQAEHDPRKVERLVQGLKSDEHATWTEAYAALVEIGLPAAGALQEAVLRKHPASGRCILALGEMGEPANFAFMEDALEIPELRPYAVEAFAIAEDLLVERMHEERQVGLCDAYLRYYPEGARRQTATLLRRDLLAEEAWMRLGRKPREADIRAFLDRYGDTASGEQARGGLASSLLVSAGKELGRQRLDEALDLVEQARAVQGGAQVDAMEAAVRHARGRAALEQLRMDTAVRELEKALALGRTAELRSLLGRAHLERARRAFVQGSPEPAMLDLQQAEQLEPILGASIEELRRKQVEALLQQLEGAFEPPEGVVEALVVAGAAAQQPLETVIWHSLAQGDPTVLERSIDAAVTYGGPGGRELSRRWCSNVVERALSEADGDAQLLLSQRPAQQALFEPDNFVSPEYTRIVDDAARALRRYVAVVAAAHHHVSRIGPVDGPLPASPPMLEADVAALFRAGHDGRDAQGLPPLTRAQLMLYQVNRVSRLHPALREHPGAVAAEILGSGLVPFQLPEWVTVLGAADLREAGRPVRTVLRDGTELRVLSERSDEELTISMVVLDAGRLEPGGTLPGAWVGDSLAVVFSLARPVMAAFPDLQRVVVVLGVAEGSAVTAPVQRRLRLAFKRRSVSRIDWALVESERPYGPQHLAFVPDHELK